MAFIDYYKIMGISKDTPQKDIKAAYKKRAKQFHPDLHPDDPKAKAKFQALNEAYDVLNDPEKRAKYDQYGEHWKMAGMGGGATGGADAGGFEGFDFRRRLLGLLHANVRRRRWTRTQLPQRLQTGIRPVWKRKRDCKLCRP